MTTHLAGFCHLSRGRDQSDRASLCVPGDGEEEETRGTRFQSVSRSVRHGALWRLFLTQGSSEGEMPVSPLGTHVLVCLTVNFTALILPHLSILEVLGTCSLKCWVPDHRLEPWISALHTHFALLSQINTGLTCLSGDPYPWAMLISYTRKWRKLVLG